MVAMVREPFARRYSLGDVLGAGGSGVVRRAHDTVLDRPVAIKLLKAGSDDEVERARLRAEAQLAGSLHHPGIAQVYDYGEDDADGGATPYIAMQYVEGTSLWQVLKERRTLGVREVMDLVAQVAAALQVAHDAGIIHRDLKPSNVLVTAEGRAVLVDFGIARSFDAEPLTNTGTLVGTADYVSPEQCNGRPATARSDLYSLGMLAYECLTGHKPFHRESAVATALAHLTEEAPPLIGVPGAVAALVAEMLAKEPEDRPSSAAEVAGRARSLAVEPEPTAEVVLPPPPAPAVVTAVRTPVWRSEKLRSRRLQVSAAAVVVALLGMIFVAARPAATELPDLEGLGWGEARQALAEQDVEVRRQLVDSPGAARGTVLGQQPRPGSPVGDGTVVVLEVASGETVLDPDAVVGLRYEEAARILVGLGLVPVRNDVSRPGGDGTVVTALPAGRLETGTMVTLTVGQAGVVTGTAPAPAPAPSSPTSGSGGGGSGDGGSGGPGKANPGKAKGHAKKG